MKKKRQTARKTKEGGDGLKKIDTRRAKESVSRRERKKKHKKEKEGKKEKGERVCGGVSSGGRVFQGVVPCRPVSAWGGRKNQKTCYRNKHWGKKTWLFTERKGSHSGGVNQNGETRSSTPRGKRKEPLRSGGGRWPGVQHRGKKKALGEGRCQKVNSHRDKDGSEGTPQEGQCLGWKHYQIPEGGAGEGMVLVSLDQGLFLSRREEKMMKGKKGWEEEAGGRGAPKKAQRGKSELKRRKSSDPCCGRGPPRGGTVCE